MDNSPPLSEDIPVYILLAKSLVDGTGYRDISFKHMPAHTGYPFVFPIILAPVVYFFGYNFLLIRILQLTFAIFSVCLTYVLFKQYVNDFSAFLISVLTGISFKLLLFSYKMVSEIPYLFFSLIALIYFEKYKQEDSWFSKTGIILGIFILLSYFTRTIGITLIACCLLYFVFEKRVENWHKKFTVLAALILIPVIIWALRNFYVGKNISPYLCEFISVNDWFDFDRKTTSIFDFGLRIAGNVYAYGFYAIPKIITGVEFSNRNFIAFFITIIVFTGFLIRLIKKRSIVEYYVTLYGLVLLMWAASSVIGVRYLVPIIPLIFYYFIIGLEKILEKVIIKYGKNIFFLLLA